MVLEIDSSGKIKKKSKHLGPPFASEGSEHLFLAYKRPGMAGEHIWIKAHAFRGRIKLTDKLTYVRRLVVEYKRHDVITRRRIGMPECSRLVNEIHSMSFLALPFSFSEKEGGGNSFLPPTRGQCPRFPMILSQGKRPFILYQNNDFGTRGKFCIHHTRPPSKLLFISNSNSSLHLQLTLYPYVDRPCGFSPNDKTSVPVYRTIPTNSWASFMGVANGLSKQRRKVK